MDIYTTTIRKLLSSSKYKMYPATKTKKDVRLLCQKRRVVKWKKFSAMWINVIETKLCISKRIQVENRATTTTYNVYVCTTPPPPHIQPSFSHHGITYTYINIYRFRVPLFSRPPLYLLSICALSGLWASWKLCDKSWNVRTHTTIYLYTYVYTYINAYTSLSCPFLHLLTHCRSLSISLSLALGYILNGHINITYTSACLDVCLGF